MREDEVLNLLRADLLAATVDQVLLAPLDDVVAGGVPAHQVAGAVEAVRRECARVVLGHVVVAAQRVRPADQQLSDLTVRHGVAVLVDDQDLVVVANRPAGGLEPNVLRVVEAYEHQQALGHAEHLLHARVRKHGFSTTLDCGLQLLSARVDDPNR